MRRGIAVVLAVLGLVVLAPTAHGSYQLMMISEVSGETSRMSSEES